MNDQRGFTILEMAVTMLLVSAVIGIAFYAYNRLASAIQTQSGSVAGTMDKLVGLELFRLDVEHAGMGIATDESNPPVEINAKSGALILRSTINNTKQDTYGWVMVDCKAGLDWDSTSVLMLDERLVQTNDDMVFIDYRGRFGFTAGGSTTKCPRDAHYIGYPVDTSSSNGCALQTCAKITYALSAGQSLSTCAAGTRNLLRKVGGGSGIPILNCVADWELRFGLDTDGDGAVDSIVDGTGVPASPADVRKQIKYVSLYVLMQNSTYDRSYDYGSSNVTLDNSVVLAFPPGCGNCKHHHWKVIKKTVKFRNL